MTRAVLSAGSNLGDRLAHLQSALDGLGPTVRGVSAVYETAPWGPVPQDDYLNVIVVVDDPAADEWEWLRRARALEQANGRTRSVRFGPRTLDVDVVMVAEVRSDDPDLVLPHPRAHERAFVLVPWLAVEPDAVLPGRGPVAALVTDLGPVDVAGVRRRDDLSLSVPFVSIPPVSIPPESVPSMSIPPVSIPPESVPPESVPFVSIPPESIPPESVPSVSVPSVPPAATSAPNLGERP